MLLKYLCNSAKYWLQAHWEWHDSAGTCKSVALRVGRGIALLFHERETRRGWVVSSTPRPHFAPGKDPVPILQEAGWAPGPVWTGGKSRPHRDSIPDLPDRSQSLYRLSYPAHSLPVYLHIVIKIFLRILLSMTNISDKICRENSNSIFLLSKFYLSTNWCTSELS